MTKIYRTTISIPQELKDEMDAVTEQVNWSAIAARAFQAKLVEIRSRKGKSMSKEDVVKRLKAASEVEEEQEYEAGKKAGREWAEQTATPKELRRLRRYFQCYEGQQAYWWDIDANWSGPYGALEKFVLAARPETIRDDHEVFGFFWEEALGEFDEWINDPDFFHGFGDGAMEVWQDVKNEL